jgi:RNA polymerase sigma-70 factor (ECF subfamily)
MDEPPEIEGWLNGVRQGDRHALAALFQHYRARLREMVRLRIDRRLSARVDPSDVLQEAYLDAARQVQGYIRRPQVAFYVWLRGLAWQRLLNLQRQHAGTGRRSVKREVSLPLESSAFLGRHLVARGTSPSGALQKEELRSRVQHALEHLEPDDREVILMRHFEDMSNGEVAQALGLTDSGATMRYGRALVRLKSILLSEKPAGESRP